MKISFALISNILIRLLIIYFLFEALLLPDDPRFAGKAILERNLVIVGGLSLIFPAIYFLNKRRLEYPFLADFLFLSIFAFDMMGNSFNLYDTVWYFDLISHFHRTGAFTAVALLIILSRQKVNAIKLSGLEVLLLAVGIATIIHVGLEAQEYYTDVFFGTHNVRGVFDIVNDIVVGFIGSTIYIGGIKSILRFNPPFAKRVLSSLAVLFSRK